MVHTVAAELNPLLTVDSASLSALAALAGASIGGLTSFGTSWLTHHAQAHAQEFMRTKAEREALYREFIEASSKLYVDALMHDNVDVSSLVGLYALISSMRILSTPAVVEDAEHLTRAILDTYFAPNKSFHDLREMGHNESVDPLRRFSEVCRQELRKLELVRVGIMPRIAGRAGASWE